MAYTVCRIQKIKDWGTLTSSELHTTRERDTPNADPAVHNIRLIGEKSDPDLATIFKAKIGNQKIRSNAVLGVEFVLSASAEYFRPDNPSIAGTYNQKRLDSNQKSRIGTRNWINVATLSKAAEDAKSFSFLADSTYRTHVSYISCVRILE